MVGFWLEPGGGVVVSGEEGRWYGGEVTGVGWDEIVGEMPRVQVTYEDGHAEWHCASQMGRAVRCAAGNVATVGKRTHIGAGLRPSDQVPKGVINCLGHGTVVQLREKGGNTGEYAWGVREEVVAVRGEEVALMAGRGKQGRRCRWVNLHKRKGVRLIKMEHRVQTNEQYQSLSHNMASLWVPADAGWWGV